MEKKGQGHRGSGKRENPRKVFSPGEKMKGSRGVRWRKESKREVRQGHGRDRESMGLCGKSQISGKNQKNRG
jgi:uncharacterized GH25 family protein